MVDETSLHTRLWLNSLADSGYRLTAPRRAVVEVVALSQHAMEPAEVFIEARRQAPNLGLVTVYRTLEKLEALGLVVRVHQTTGCHGYIAAPDGHQHLLICESCGKAEYFSGDNLERLIETIGLDRGYQIREHWLQLFGLCPECK